MSKFKFPKNPGAERDNPFEDDSGKNPFGDQRKTASDDKSEPAEDANPYAAQEHDGVQPYRPNDYETFLPHRGRLIFWLGAVGLGVQLLAILVATIAIFVTGNFLEGMVYGLPGQLVGVAVSAPAWVMGHSDWLAIEAGAMTSDGAPSTRAGLRLGIIGTLLGATQLFFFLGLSVYNEFFV